MLFRVSFWNDAADEEVYGKTVRAKDENEAEDIFFDELEEKNDYSDEYPVLVQEAEEEFVNLDFENLFCRALTATIERNGGSISDALDEIGVGDDTTIGRAIKLWYCWGNE